MQKTGKLDTYNVELTVHHTANCTTETMVTTPIKTFA